MLTRIGETLPPRPLHADDGAVGSADATGCAARGLNISQLADYSLAAKTILRARARRAAFFNDTFFYDPAWDILLELFVARLDGRTMNVSAVGSTANVPVTTSLRWINVFIREGLLERRPDPDDARRSLVSLADKGVTAMMLYLRSSGSSAAAL